MTLAHAPFSTPVTAARAVEAAADNISRSWLSLIAGQSWRAIAQRASRDTANAATGNGELDAKAYRDFMNVVTESGFPGALQTHLLLSFQDQATIALWSEFKTVYLLDDSLWDALANTDPSGEIPAEVFRRLPHPNPYVAFPRPLDSLSDSGDVLRVEGMWITGRKPVPVGQALCSTHDPNVDALVLLFNGYSVNPDNGQPVVIDTQDANGTSYRLVDSVLSRSTIRLATSSLDAHIKEAVRKVGLSNEVAGEQASSVMLSDSTVAGLIRTAIISLVYLCSEDPDIAAAVDERRKRKGRKGSGYMTPRVFPVGYRIGAALRAHNTDTRTRQQGAETGRTVAPHIRKAHFHTYAVGPGRTERVVKWLAPIPVKVDTSARAAVPTVHRVR